jgi:hypothetical protein
VAAEKTVTASLQDADCDQRKAQEDGRSEPDHEERGPQDDRHDLALGVVVRAEHHGAPGLYARDAPDEVDRMLAPLRRELLKSAGPFETEVNGNEERCARDQDQRRPPEIGEGPHDADRPDDETHRRQGELQGQLRVGEVLVVHLDVGVPARAADVFLRQGFARRAGEAPHG